MLNLKQLLSRFNPIMIQRSRSYLNKINLETFEIIAVDQVFEIYAQIKGHDFYDTFVVYDPKLKSIVDTECSCPVGHNCKHCAALAQVFYEQCTQGNLPELKSILLKPPALPLELDEHEAMAWMMEFDQVLQELTPKAPQNLSKYSQFVYLLKQKNQQLYAELYKVRRTKSGDVRDAKPYTAFANILHHGSDIGDTERQLFQQLHNYAGNLSVDFNQGAELKLHLYPLEQFKQLILSNNCFCHDTFNKPLQWAEEPAHLEIVWQQNPKTKYEKMVIQLIIKGKKPILIDSLQHDFDLLYTQPICILDKKTTQIYALNNDFPYSYLQKIRNMPEIPPKLITNLSDTLEQHTLTETLPKAKIIQEMQTLTGACVPLLRFGGHHELADGVFQHEVGVAELSFIYPSGTVLASHPHAYFYTQKNNQTVRQMRNLEQEQQWFARLNQLLPSLQWFKSHELYSKFQMLAQDSLVAANHYEWIQAFLPSNELVATGFKVEHLDGSLYYLEATSPIEMSLHESRTQQDWFSVGATIQDSRGKRHDLLELLADIIKQYPYLLDPNTLKESNENSIISFKVASDQPALAVFIRDIKPILLHLHHLLQQDEPLIDRYEATELLDLEHHLGMTWQSPTRLQQFADKLKQSYQSQLPTPQGFQGELRPYQQQGLAWLQFLRETAHGGVLADDMGLGKTAQTLAHLLMEKHAGHLAEKPALIIAPTSLMHNWFKEAKKFAPELNVLILQGHDRHQHFRKIPTYDVVLSTYPLLARDEEYLTQYQFHLLILDEAQNIKNPRAKSAQVARHIQAKHRLCLTGTPMENHLGELWSLFYFLMPGFLGSQDIFNKQYRHPIEKKGDQDVRQRLIKRIQPFILRRLKTDVAKELPEKTTIEVNIDMNEQQSKLYEAVRATMQKNIRQIIAEKGFKRSQIQILDALLKLRQVCCHPALLKLENINTDKTASAKLDHLIDMVGSMVEEGRKILIFSQFTSMLQLIEEHLTAKKIALVKLTGQTKKREDVIDAFQCGDIPVFLISLKAGGVGLNLTAADTVIHYDPWWNPAAEDQASDRAWRIGQDKPVFVYKMITNQSIEEKILDMQQNKAELAKSILSTDHEGEVKLTEDTVLQLLDSFE